MLFTNVSDINKFSSGEFPAYPTLCTVSLWAPMSSQIRVAISGTACISHPLFRTLNFTREKADAYWFTPNGPDYCTLREITGDDWNKLVKWNCAHTNVNVVVPTPPEYDEDFFSGAVSKDTFGIWECQPPTPTDVQQIVAKTSKAITMMAERLICVICIT